MRTILSAFTLLCAASCAQSDEPVFTLQQCVDAALRNENAVRRMELGAEKARNAVGLANAQAAPIITSAVKVNTSTSADIYNTSPGQTSIERERARIGLDLRYPLFDAGKHRALIKSAQAGERAEAESARAEQVRIIVEATRLYYAVVRQQRLARTAAIEREFARETKSAALARYQVGSIAKAELTLAESAAAGFEGEAAKRASELIAMRARMAVLMGLDPSKSLPVVAEPPSPKTSTVGLEQVIVRAIETNPERAQLLAKRDGARAQLSAVRADRSPQIDLKSSAGLVKRDRNSSSSSTRGGPAYLQATLDIRLPIFEGPSIKAREKSQAAEVELIEVAIREVEARLREEAVAAYGAMLAAETRVETFRVTAEAQRETVRLAGEFRAVGRGTQSSVNAARLAAARAADALAEAICERDIAVQNLRWLVGEDQPPPPASAPGTGKTSLRTLLDSPRTQQAP